MKTSRFIVWVHAALALIVMCGCASAPAARDSANRFPEDARANPGRHVVVTVRNGDNGPAMGVGSTPRGYGLVTPYVATREARDQAHDLEKRYGLHEVAAWPILVLDVYCLVYRIDEGVDRDSVIAQLRHDPRVESAQPLSAFTTQAVQLPVEARLAADESSKPATQYNDTYAQLQLNLSELAIPQAQEWSRGEGVRIALIDTGVALDHADLKGRIAGWRNFVDDDETRFRQDHHGTAVAGVMAAVANNNVGIVGIAPEVKLLAYKACWEAAEEGGALCNTFTLARALAAAIDARVHIVNLSLAGPSDPLLTRLVHSAQRAGIIVVGAAAPNGKGFPVDIEGVIGVDVLGSSNAARGFIGAPGEDIFTLTPANHYDAASGSSLAAAEVSAMIALLRARDSRVGAQRARTLLEASARPVSTSSGMRTVISACRAMSSLGRGVVCSTSEMAPVAEDTRFRR
jgi:hypothetical protein